MCAPEILPKSWSVVRDTEDRYSVWPDDKAVPVGWTKEPISGTRDACLQMIREIWSDPRPLALRRAMA
ncbi:MAG: MbtH family NRPS accessory protein [Phyllobacterium sp.]|uniref:MbtH family protein n=1 Tax=Phyllobacterium sp. TaxID=1871046 RepID=UPI0030F0E4BC